MRSLRAARAVDTWSHAVPRCHARSCVTAAPVSRVLTSVSRNGGFSSPRAAFHSFSRQERRAMGHNNEEVPDGPPTTDFGRMDVLGNTPVPSTSVDVCMSDGFQLNSGIKILGGNGALLIGGEAFTWQPWGPGKTLVNAKGQWEVDNGAFGLLSLVWPRPGRWFLSLYISFSAAACVPGGGTIAHQATTEAATKGVGVIGRDGVSFSLADVLPQ